MNPGGKFGSAQMAGLFLEGFLRAGMSEEKKRGRGGKRTGSGRPRDALKGERFLIYLSGNDADLVRERAKEEGITPYSWLAQTIRRVLWGKK